MTISVVYNACHGSFSITTEALRRMKELGFTRDVTQHEGRVFLYDCERHDPILVQTVKELGPKASGRHGCLRIAEVSGPYRIEEHDGWETVYEPNDYDWITP